MLSYAVIIPAITLLLLIVGGIAAVFIKPVEFKDSRTSVFISIMGSIAVVVLSLNVILTTVGLESQNSINKAQFTKTAIDKLWLFPNQLLKEAEHVRPEFIASLYYNNATFYKLTEGKKTPPTMRSEAEEQYITIVLIQSWEDYLTLRNLDHTGEIVWLHNFIQWAQSPYLKKKYDNIKYNFAQSTIDFGDLLFEYAAHIPVPSNNPAIYKETI
ncbi:MAG TPA: hypothetical protein DD412_03075 [Holosporales bacterium]|nr:hypothetical protein [Holosporales bacterium]